MVDVFSAVDEFATPDKPIAVEPDMATVDVPSTVQVVSIA